MDFFRIKEETSAKGVVAVYPDFRVCRSKDLMIRGKAFYAIWDDENKIWSEDEYDVQRLVDQKLWDHRNELAKRSDGSVLVKLMSDFSSGSWRNFRSYMSHLSDSAHQLDESLTFANTDVKKSDYVSRRLPYSLEAGDISAWNEILDTLYDPEEREKIEWAIGSVIAGDSKKIQKFFVWYGAPGTGKGTVLDIIQKLFEGYISSFDAKTLTSSSAFAVEAFKGNPLVAIDPDGDLSKIEDNTRLNAVVSHELMLINEKNKPTYTARINALLLIATNKAVKFTDAKSGLIRRMIDVRPTGAKIPVRRYHTLVSQVDFELGAIANHCLEVYRERGKDFYSGYRPVEMMLQTDVFFNFIEANYDIFREQNGVSLQQAYDMYKTFCDESGIDFKMAKFKLREELKNYFSDFEERAWVDGARVRSWFSGFNADHFKVKITEDPVAFSLVMDEHESIIDDEFANFPAQYSRENGNPTKYWTNAPKSDGKGGEFIPKPDQVVSTVLSEIDTTKEHFVKVPINHIVIDFDLKDTDGKKSAERNLEAASKWPSTYAEYSKSGSGVHLHYNYDGDPTELNRVYDDGIEIKVFTGDSSLRRRLSKCNNVPIATISTGLPLKEKKMINTDTVKSEKALRDLVERNLRKEIHPGTKPSMDFIHKILNDAYYSDTVYDLTDMRSKILSFANNSSHQALYCIKLVQDMKFKSEDVNPNPTDAQHPGASFVKPSDDRLVIFDVEVFPNLFIVSWKYKGSPTVVRMVNPTAQAIEELMNMKLVGFNNRRYDNHILYGRFMGYDNERLYQLSKKIVSGVPGALFGEAYNISYADIYDFSSKKQSLKKFQIELGLRHKELGLPWDEPVDESLWELVGEYCDNDVITTEQVLDDRWQDLVARQILADLSGLSVNDTTQKHTAQIVFEGDREAQKEFLYTDLSEMFEGYEYDFGKSTYRGEVTGEGGYVYAEPGMYSDVALLDVESMHPTSIKELDLFGPYTKNFWGLVQARLAIKHGDYETAKTLLGGKLAPYLNDPEQAAALSYALKIIINIVYGLTSAKFDNPFRDARNKDNIVAKRGALFMIDLKHFVQEHGFTVAHIKTDSIKIPNATKEIIDLVMEFGEKYGYVFEHEATYEKFCLVNDAVYIAKTKAGKKPSYWEATGAQFKHPYVYKTLFSKEPLTFRDKCEAKMVTTALYIDFNADGAAAALEGADKHFVGKAGLFCPMKEGTGGGILLREKEGKHYAATGSKGYFWMEAEMVQALGKEEDIDFSYFDHLVNEAVDAISVYGDFEQFVD